MNKALQQAREFLRVQQEEGLVHIELARPDVGQRYPPGVVRRIGGSAAALRGRPRCAPLAAPQLAKKLDKFMQYAKEYQALRPRRMTQICKGD